MLTKEILESWYTPKTLKVRCECLTQEEEEVAEEVDVCEFCGGTGELSSMEQVHAGEPHMADIGTRKCICQIKDEDEYDPDRELSETISTNIFI